MHNPLLNQLATEIVANKVMEDKMNDFQKKQEQQEEENKKVNVQNPDEQEEDEDIFKVDSDEEKIMESMKEKRLNEKGIKKQRDRSVEKKKTKFKYGEYREIQESDFLDTLLQNEKVVCHFYHEEFEKCKVMDKHLMQIAYEHTETLFVKINAQNAPFFSVKLQIQVLPTVLFSNNGKVFDRIIGFEELDGVEDFKTITLIRKLVISKMIIPKNAHEKGEQKTKKLTKFNNQDDSDDEDY